MKRLIDAGQLESFIKGQRSLFDEDQQLALSMVLGYIASHSYEEDDINELMDKGRKIYFELRKEHMFDSTETLWIDALLNSTKGDYTIFADVKTIDLFQEKLTKRNKVIGVIFNKKVEAFVKNWKRHYKIIKG